MATSSGFKGISRVDYAKRNQFGWSVRVRYKGENFAKFFSDSSYGGREAALTAALMTRMGTLCSMMNVAPAAQQAPSAIKAPVLMLSGENDPVTPPRRARAAGELMAKVQHLTVAHVGHGISQLGCSPRLLREFLDKPEQTLDAACLKEIPAPTFQLGSAGPHP